jgi:hypothetical protein
MSLAAGERRALTQIEGALRRSDPKLAVMLSTFNRLTRCEEMPRREFVFGRGPLRWLPARPGPWPDRWRGRIAGILPLVIATCALGLVVVVFAALSHVRPAGATQGRATSCHSVTLAGCQSAGHTTHKR